MIRKIKKEKKQRKDEMRFYVLAAGPLSPPKNITYPNHLSPRTQAAAAIITLFFFLASPCLFLPSPNAAPPSPVSVSHCRIAKWIALDSSPVLSDPVLFSYHIHLSRPSPVLHLSTATQGQEEVSEGSIRDVSLIKLFVFPS
uniref:Uncharacterized protein n=1 Tax=Setaria viridis TaxID=4556 RepID=A0A4U6UKK2_SETVI|nr:hypothetical protein SEVIR_5G165600v2 [Setaria viridis]